MTTFPGCHMSKQWVRQLLFLCIALIFNSQLFAQYNEEKKRLKFPGPPIGLVVDDAQNVLFGESLFGEGSKFMWMPTLSALRAGNPFGDVWDYPSITPLVGMYSVAFGKATLASGELSLAVGDGSTATGFAASSFGFSTLASGFHSFATGDNSRAYAPNSTAMGRSTRAHGRESLVTGVYNDTIISVQDGSSVITSETPIFIVGNGTNSSNRSNAFIVRYDGRVGVGNNVPQYDMEVTHGNRFPSDAGTDDAFSIRNAVTGSAWQFHVNGFDNYLSIYLNGVYKNGFKPDDGTLVHASDRRLKKDISTLGKDELNKFLSLRPVKYQMKNRSSGSSYSFGLIAQEVQPLFPDLVSQLGTEEGLLGLSYTGFIPLTIQATQELYRKVEEMEAQNSVLRNENMEMKQIVEALTLRVEQLENK